MKSGGGARQIFDNKRKEQTVDQRHWREYHRQNCEAPLLQDYNVIKYGCDTYPNTAPKRDTTPANPANNP